MENAEENSRAIPIRNVLIAAFLIRVSIPLYIAVTTQDFSLVYEPYTDRYLDLARDLVLNGRFALNGIPELYRVPGYPILLFPGILGGHMAGVTIAIQILLSCLTVYLVCRIALMVFRRSSIAIACAWMLAIEPLSVIFSTLLMPETFLTFAVTLFLLGMIRYLNSGSQASLVLAACAASLSAFVSPIAYGLPVAVSVTLVAVAYTQKRARMALHSTVFLVLSMGLMGMWQARNYLETGYAGFSTAYVQSLYFAQAPAVLSVAEGRSEEAIQSEMSDRLHAYQLHHPHIASQMDFLRTEGLRALSSYPLTYTIIHVKGMLRTMTGLAVHGYARLLDLLPKSPQIRDELLAGKGFMKFMVDNRAQLPQSLIVLSLTIGGVTVALYALAAGELLRGELFKNALLMMLLVTAGYFLVVTGGPHGYSRYRVPVMPVICILAGSGLFHVVEWLRSRRRRFE